MTDRLQKQARGLLEEIEVGDWVVWSPDYEEPFSPQNPRPVERFKMMGTGERRRKALFAGPGFSDLTEATYDDAEQWRLATPQELLDHGIIDEIPNPEYPDDPHEPMRFMGHLTNPSPLPQGDWTLSTLVQQGFIYIVHSQPTKDGPVVHYRLTDEGREVVR